MMGVRTGTFGSVQESGNDLSPSIWQTVPLTDFFNNVAITSDGVEYISGGSFGLDGDTVGSNGNVYSGNALIPYLNAGTSTFTYEGVTFDIPLPYTDDNPGPNSVYCAGQTIPLVGYACSSLELIGWAVNGSYGGQQFSVTYADSATSDFFLSFSDWFSGLENAGSFTDETAVIGIGNPVNRDDINGNISGGPVFMYRYIIPLDITRTPATLVLPNNQFISFISLTQVTSTPSMIMWMTADSLGDYPISLSTGDQVEHWTDISGYNILAEQTTSELQPIYVTEALNGHAVVRFTGGSLSGGQFTTGQYLPGAATASANYSAFVVFRSASGAGFFQVAFSWGDGTGSTYWTGYVPDSSPTAYPGHLIDASDSHYDIYDAGDIDDTNPHLCEGIFDGSTLAGWADAVGGVGTGPDASGNHNSSSSALNSNAFNIGCYANTTIFWNGDVAEIILFNTNLSDSDRGLVEDYLMYKYGLGPG